MHVMSMATVALLGRHDAAAPCTPAATQLQHYTDNRDVLFAHSKFSRQGSHGDPVETLLSAVHRIGMVPRNATFLDVGANKGHTALHILSLWGKQWQRLSGEAEAHYNDVCAPHKTPRCEPPPISLHLYDMNPSNVELLGKLMQRFHAPPPAVRVHLAAMSDKPGQLPLKCSEGPGDEHATIGDRGSRVRWMRKCAHPLNETVPIVTLSGAVDELGVDSISIIKCDAEGEPRVRRQHTHSQRLAAQLRRFRLCG